MQYYVQDIIPATFRLVKDRLPFAICANGKKEACDIAQLETIYLSGRNYYREEATHFRIKTDSDYQPHFQTIQNLSDQSKASKNLKTGAVGLLLLDQLQKDFVISNHEKIFEPIFNACYLDFWDFADQFCKTKSNQALKEKLLDKKQKLLLAD
jgi:hypothetical protein